MYLFQHEDFSDFITQVADERGIPAAIVEKDYWVAYLLYRLKTSEFSGSFIFKGGTSLSMAWNLLERFSEDVDLLFIPDKKLDSKNKHRNRLQSIEVCVAKFEGLNLEKVLHESRAGDCSRTSCYRYERKNEHPFGSLRPFIKLEMGFRGGLEPHSIKNVQSYLGKSLEAAGQIKIAEDIAAFEVEVLHPRRTFVEKLFAIHAAAASGKTVGQSRHYYDIYKLLKLDEIRTFIGAEEYKALKQSVYEFSKAEFPKSPIIEPGKLRDSPGIHLSVELAKSLQREIENSEMIFGFRPSVKAVIAELERFRELL
jgi:hypothetical protein